MNEIERKGGLLLSEEEANSIFINTSTPGTVAEAISSALETADDTGESSHLLHFQHQFSIPTESSQQEATNEDQLFLTNNKNNRFINLDENDGILVNASSEHEQKLNDCNINNPNRFLRERPFYESHNHNQQNYVYENGGEEINCFQKSFPPTSTFVDTGNESKDCEQHKYLSTSSSSIRLDADENHVCGIHEVSSVCSPFLSSAETTTLSMASENKKPSDFHCVSSNRRSSGSIDSDQNLRDKSDNRETHSVSYHTEKPATHSEESFDGDSRVGRVFKPSSKVIELPDKSSSTTNVSRPITHDHQHTTTKSSQHLQHHHHHRNKESKIPVGIAVAWQRFVTTSSSTSPTATLTMSSKAEHNISDEKGFSLSNSPTKFPARPTSASPLSVKSGRGNNHVKSNIDLASGKYNNNEIRSGASLVGRESIDNQAASNRPLSACGGEAIGGLIPFSPTSASPLSRPLPSSSVPPNMGFPGSSYHSAYPFQGYHQRSSPFLEYPYGSNPNVDRTFAIPSPLSSPHHHSHSSGFLSNGHSYWGGIDNTSVSPLLTSGIPTGPGASDYLQLSMQQQQLHLHHQQHLLASNRQSSLPLSSSPYNPYLAFIYPHQETNSPGGKNPYYDHYLQQQQNQILRQQQHENLQMRTSGLASSSNNSSNNDNVSNSENNRGNTMNSNRSGEFDLLANNNRSSSSTHQQNRTVPMEVAHSRTNIPQFCHIGGIRTSSSPDLRAMPADTEGNLALATTTTTTATLSIASSKTTNSSSTNTTPHQSLSQSEGVSSSGEQQLCSSTFSSSSSSASSTSSLLLLHQQQNPHLFTSSSAALSPKSLTSSTPSPVTVHDFNSGLNVIIGSNSNNITTSSTSNNAMITARKCATPSPVSLAPRALLSPYSSPFSPSPTLSNNGGSNYKDRVWKDDNPSKNFPLPNSHLASKDFSDQPNSAGSSLTTTPTSSPLLHRRSKQLKLPTPLSSPNSQQKHDFKRLESLIEKRDSESISPLVLIPQSSPATSTTSSMLDAEESKLILHCDPIEPEDKANPNSQIIGREDNDSYTKTNREENDLVKMKLSPAEKVEEKVKENSMLCELPLETDFKAEKVKGKSDKEKVEPLLTNKNFTISSCDANNQISSGVKAVPSEKSGKSQHDIDESKICNDNESNVVPESTLLLSSFSKNSSSNVTSDNNSCTKNNCVNNSSVDTIAKVDERSNGKMKQQNIVSVKHHDISFTSGYCSSNDDIDNNEYISPVPVKINGKSKKQSALLSVKAEGMKNKGVKKESKRISQTSEPIKKKVETNSKKVVITEQKKGKSSSKKGKVFKEPKGKIRGQQNTKSGTNVTNFELSSFADKIKPSKHKTSPKKLTEDKLLTSVKRQSKNDRKNNMKAALPIRKKKSLICDNGKLVMASENMKNAIQKCKKNKKATNYKMQKLEVSDSSNKNDIKNVLISPSQTKRNNSSAKLSTNKKSKKILGDTKFSDSNNISRDSVNENIASDTLMSISLVAGQQQQQPVALFHQSANSKNNKNPSSSIQTNLRIPAYIPRCTSNQTIAPTASEVAAASILANELVGEQDINGPSTLTLHRDVDAFQQQYCYQDESQIPPAITIQYHHSAPATPLMDAVSPYGSVRPEESSLNLLATVAQEFGSREDLGKRLSIDGSCNNSSIGESPPMSPVKSPQYTLNVQQIRCQQIQQQQENACVDAILPSSTSGLIKDVVSDVVNLYSANKYSSEMSKISKKKSAPKGKKIKETSGKTSNSITTKKKVPKVGKKEKRSVSDCGVYSKPVVLLKIPKIKRSVLSEQKKKVKKQEKAEKARGKQAGLVTTASQDSDHSTTWQKSTELLWKKSEVNTQGKSITSKTKKILRHEDEKSSSLSLPSLKLSSTSVGVSTKKDKTNKVSSVVSSSSACFYSPPERISAFAKQVIARRDSSLATSPTKTPLSPKPTFSNFVSPDASKSSQNDIMTSSPSASLNMPQLTPFDLEQNVDSGIIPRPPSLTAPPPLTLSVSSAYVEQGSSLRDVINSVGIPEQDTKKTETVAKTGSPASFNNISIGSKAEGKIKKDFTKEERQRFANKGKRKPDLLSSKKGETKEVKSVNREVYIPSKRVTKSFSAASSSIRKVPKIKITTVEKEASSCFYTSSTNLETNPMPFSPLTPPLTAKLPSSEDENTISDSGARELSYLPVSNTPPSSSRRSSSPSNTGNDEKDVEIIENEFETDLNNVWVADPMFAVSAIKLTNSNQPSDISSVSGADSSSSASSNEDEEGGNDKKKRKTSLLSTSRSKSSVFPPKLSQYQKQLSQQLSNNVDREGDDNQKCFISVKSQLSAFVHFKPKQLTSGKKKGNSHIKPCLKAEPVVKSQSESEESDKEDAGPVDDEDFELDMEVAKITTRNSQKDSTKYAAATTSNSTATSALSTSTSASDKKAKINRNRLSYLNSYASKKNPSSIIAPLSTKEIMTKVFSRKVSPELAGEKKKQKASAGSSKKRRVSEIKEAEVDDDNDKLIDINDSLSNDKHKDSHNNNSNAHVSMSAAAAAVISQNNTTATVNSSSFATTSLSSTSQQASASIIVLPPIKKSPKKRSARSSTTSSSASTKSSSRGTRGLGGFSSYSALPDSASAHEKDETLCPGKVELDSVEELVDEMRILTEIQGLFYTGRLNALQPPDVYGVTMNNERGAPPHLIFSAEEVLEKCLREKKPLTLTSGLRICAYWSPQYSGLYPGRVSSDFNPKFDPDEDLIPIEFDDGDTGMIKLKEIRLLSTNHPIREYDPNPLLTLEKKHRKRRHSSATGTSVGCTGDHEEPDCGEPYCAKIGNLEEEEDEDDFGESHHSSSKMLYWAWSGLGFKKPKSKKDRNKEFFHGIQRGDEILNVGDAALFISTGNERPFIGRVERFWERKGKKMVNVRWFYHPEEVKASAKRLSNLKYPGALFESPHIDENDVQTIAKKCDVVPFADFKQRLCATSVGSPRLAKLSAKSSSKPRDMYYIAGFYDPYTYNLTLKDLK